MKSTAKVLLLCFLFGLPAGLWCSFAWNRQAELPYYRELLNETRNVRELPGAEQEMDLTAAFGILWQRIRQWVFARILSAGAAPAMIVLTAFCGFSAGWLLAGYLRLYGCFGIFWMLLAVSPQFLAYGFSYYLMSSANSQKQRAGKLKRRFGSFLCMLAGISLEVKIHPLIMKWIMNFF